MIVNPPRSEAEFSPLLRAISVYAADQFEYPEDVRLVIPARIKRRLGVPILLVLATIVTHFGLRLWTSRITTPSGYAVRADEFRGAAQIFEEEAKQYRAMAATGKPGSFSGRGNPISPTMALQLATKADQNAASCRNTANIEERKNLGLPVP